MKKHILLICADSSQTGAPSQVLFLAKGLMATNKVSVICPPGWLADTLTTHKITSFPLDPSSLAITRKALCAAIAELKPDLINAHGIRAGLWTLLTRTTIPWVYTEHVWTPQYKLGNPLRHSLQRTGLCKILKTARISIGVSDSVTRFLRSLGANSTQTIYSAVTTTPLKKLVNTPAIGTLGSLLPIKGTSTLLRAVSLLVSSHDTIHCYIAGTGPQLASLQKEASVLGIANHITWLGQLSDATKLHQKISVYVQPSLSESFGMTPLEASGAGIPTIITTVGALPEVLPEGTSMHVPPNDPPALATAIAHILDDHILACELAEAGMRQAQKFTPEHMVAAYIAVYTELTT